MNGEKLLLIETSTALCSVALAKDGEIISYRESSEPRAHASLTAVFIDEIFKEQHISATDCSAVCVSMGPGSYTGLRVGVSTAKGLCFGSGIPLLAVGTLDTLVWQALDEGLVPEGCSFIIPMIDARRMEVYSAVFDASGRQISETRPEIITGETFNEYRGKGKILYIGDGTRKCEEILGGRDSVFIQCFPKASSMLHPAENEYKEKRLKDIAYFEPFYLKEFVATVSRKKLF